MLGLTCLRINGCRPIYGLRKKKFENHWYNAQFCFTMWHISTCYGCRIHTGFLYDLYITEYLDGPV